MIRNNFVNTYKNDLPRVVTTRDPEFWGPIKEEVNTRTKIENPATEVEAIVQQRLLQAFHSEIKN